MQPDTREGSSAIKSKPEKKIMHHLKHDIPKTNLQIAEWKNEISIDRKTYS